MTERCPFCGGSGEIDISVAGDVADVLSRPDSPSPSALYAQTGGGESYRRAMVRHGYVIVNADVRCGAQNGQFSCLLRRDHDGPHVCSMGEWEQTS